MSGEPDATPPDATAQDAQRSDAIAAGDSGRDAGPPIVICAGRRCAFGEECCFLTGECFSSPGECGDDADAGPSGCGSNADCRLNEFCYSEARTCLGRGRCVPRLGYFDCGGAHQEVCGCDGRTYDTICDAAVFGVRTASARRGACGSAGLPGESPHPPLCGSDDAYCPESSCCAATGLCLPPDCPECCFIPAENGMYPCPSDDYCTSFNSRTFCGADTCDGVGTCFYRQPSSECGGVLEPVCGCDGVSYSNACYAQSAGVRVAAAGACDE